MNIMIKIIIIITLQTFIISLIESGKWTTIIMFTSVSWPLPLNKASNKDKNYRTIIVYYFSKDIFPN